MQLTFNHAVIQLAAFISFAAEAAFEERVGAENILFHRRLCKCLSQFPIQFLRCLQVEKPLAIRRVGKQDAVSAVITFYSIGVI